MKDYLYGLIATAMCGFMLKGNIVTIIIAIVIACTGVWYILKKKPQKTMFYGILTGFVLIMLLPAGFRWL